MEHVHNAPLTSHIQSNYPQLQIFFDNMASNKTIISCYKNFHMIFFTHAAKGKLHFIRLRHL